MKDNGILKIYDVIALFTARLGPLGRLPKMPGTAGSALAAVLAPFLFFPLEIRSRILLLVVLFVFGALAASRVEKITGTQDPREVIIDEVLGQWLTFLPFAPLGIGQIMIGFALFRLFDILKPWPIRQSEHWLPGGFGVMLDDALAGIYAALLLGVFQWIR